MDLDAFEIKDVTTWQPEAHNTAGRRAKEWLKDPTGQLWLFKLPLARRPTEPAIEAFTARLARFVGLDAPKTHVAVSDNGRATLARNFLGSGEVLSHGSEVLQRHDDAYEPARHEGHRLDRIRSALVEREVDPKHFVGLLAFDLWVGNSDRHQENWGIVWSTYGARLAPAYDTAACLGAELLDPQVGNRAADLQARRAYVEACPSGFGDGSRLIRQVDVLRSLLDWPEWRGHAREWAGRFLAALPAATRYLESVPEDWWPALRRKFAAAMLWRRLLWLWSHLP